MTANKLREIIRRYSVKPNEAFSWFLAFASVAWLTRYYTIYHIYLLNSTVWPSDQQLMRGLASDAACALLVTAVCFLVLRLRILVILIALIWCFFASGNHANIVVNDAHLSIFDVGEGAQKDFILGSALSRELLIRAFILAIIFCIIRRLSYGIQNLFRRIKVSRPWLWAVGFYGACFTVMTATFADYPNYTGWTSCNIVENNLQDIFEGEPSIKLLRMDMVSKYMYRDTSGMPQFKFHTNDKPNILLLAIEGLSANMLDNGWTPHLAQRINHSIYYNNFVATSDRTINGMYSLVCGDYPRLYKRRWQLSSESVSKLPQLKRKLYCLPRILGDYGYYTAFMQAADLKFDNKRRFNNIAGFDQQFGKKSYARIGRENAAWGPNDAVFFSHLHKKMTALSKARRPWFITALTVGTHHPYILPKDYHSDLPPKKAAFAFMDEQLDKLLNQMEKDGLLKNTLVMITSDEGSWNTFSNFKIIKKAIDASRGFLMVLTPDKQVSQVDDLFMQHDIALSITDYIGIPQHLLMQGRSIFRHYNSFRPFLYGSTLRYNLGGMINEGELIRCFRRRAESCRKYKALTGSVYNTDLEEVPISSQEATFFLQLATTLTERAMVKPYDVPSAKRQKKR